MTTIDLMQVDVLPAKCAVEGEVERRDDGLYARFRAIKLRRGVRKERRSEWSGWFPLQDEPIALRWETFW